MPLIAVKKGTPGASSADWPLGAASYVSSSFCCSGLAAPNGLPYSALVTFRTVWQTCRA